MTDETAQPVMIPYATHLEVVAEHLRQTAPVEGDDVLRSLAAYKGPWTGPRKAAALIERLVAEKAEAERVARDHYDWWRTAIARAEAAEADAARLRKWLDNNTTHYNTAERESPVLASVSKRIWYHASDDMESWPFSAAIDAAMSEQVDVVARLTNASLSCSKGQRGDIHHEAAAEITALRERVAELEREAVAPPREAIQCAYSFAHGLAPCDECVAAGRCRGAAMSEQK
jgi:hypothetical protein